MVQKNSLGAAKKFELLINLKAAKQIACDSAKRAGAGGQSDSIMPGKQTLGLN
jgi:hypothetical protein